MRDLPNSAGSFGYGETSGETGDNATPASGKAFFKDLIRRANTVPMVRVFKFYGVRVDSVHNKSVCPFKSHKGGRENTASFKYYEDTNSFYCFGCKVGGQQSHACEFIAAMDGISRAKAAYKILSLFESDIDDTAEVFDGQNLSEQLEIMMDFANSVREFRKVYLDKESQDFIEKRCEVYDELNAKRVMDNETLRSVVEHLKEQINFYKSCHTR
jgi:hypothetical protein